MRTPPLLADFTHAKPCKPFCEKSLTLTPPHCRWFSFTKKSALSDNRKCGSIWRRRWDSNPRDVLPSTRFRVELVMTTSILLHVRACSYRRLFIISETLQKDKSFFGLLRNFYLTRNASGRYRPSGFWDSVVGLVISRPSYTMTEDEPPSSMDA